MLNVSPALVEAFNPRGGIGPRSIDYNFIFNIVEEEALDHQVPSATLANPELTRLLQTVRADASSPYISFEYGGWPLDGTKLVPPFGERSRNDKYITCENTGWPLDGSGVVPPRPHEHELVQIGYISSVLSDADGVFTSPAPTFTVDFGAYPQRLLAITVDFGESILSVFDVCLYNASLGLITTINVVSNTKNVCTVNIGLDGIKRIVIVPVRTFLPYRSFRIRHFYPGSSFVFNKGNTNSVTMTMSCDILGERIESGSLRVRCPNFSGVYDIVNPQGIFAYFKDWQEVTGRVGAQTMAEYGLYEYMPAGFYYVNAPKFENNYRTLIFEAVDILGKIAATTYNLGVIQGTMTIAQLLDTLAGIADVTITYPAVFTSKNISVFIRKKTELHRLLANVAQLTGCIVRASRYHKRRIEYIECKDSPLVRILTNADYRMEGGITISDAAKIGQLSLAFSDITASGEAPRELVSCNLSAFPGAALLGYTLFADGVELRFSPSKYNCILDYDTPAVSISAQTTGGVFKVKGTPAVIQEGRAITGEQAYNLKEMYGNNLLGMRDAPGLSEVLYGRLAEKTKETAINYRGYPYLELGDALGVFLPETGLLPPQIITELKLDMISGGMAGQIKTKEA